MYVCLPTPARNPRKDCEAIIRLGIRSLHLAVSVATAAIGAEPHRVTKSQRSINSSCGSSETVGDLVLLGRKESLPLPLGRGMRLGRPILGPNGESTSFNVTTRAHSHIRGKGSRVATRAGVLEVGRVGHVPEATCHDHLGRDTATKRLNLLPDVAEESVAGPATKQRDGVHRYTVEIHRHCCQRAKGVESDAL